MLERFDRKLTNWGVADEVLPYPLLAEVPRIRRSRSLAVVDLPTSRESADAFRLLASSTLHAQEEAARGIRRATVMPRSPKHPMLAITSAVRSEGKSLIAANLGGRVR